jgi:Flp pilus assembly protein TadG
MVGREKDKGQGIAELALVLPVLLMVVFGMIEMARLVQTYLAVQHAAREGARYAVVGLPSEDECATAYGHSCTARLPNGDVCPTEYSAFRTEAIKDKAREAAIGLPWDPSVTNASAPRYLGVWVQGQPSFYDEALMDCPGVPGARVRVRVFFNLPVITPILSGIMPTIQVSAETEMINEGFQTWVGAQAPPVLTVMPTLEPLDTDGDGLYDRDEFMGQCPYVNNPDSDFDGISDGEETSHILDGWDRCDPYSPYTPTPEIDPPTPTNTPTATPIPLQIDEPLRANDVVVTGVGDPTYLPVNVEVWDWTTNERIGYGIIESSRTFRIVVSPPLVAGHKIRVFGSYAWDEATVVGATNTPTNTPTATNTPTPTSTRTPTATPTPSPAISIASPTPPAGMIYSCTDNVGADLVLTVEGSGWPGDGETEVFFGWNGTSAASQSYTGNAGVVPETDGTFSTSFTVTGSQVTEGKHNLYAFVVLTGQQTQAPLYVPCSSVPTPTPTKTPTPTRTPTFTPTPARQPDLLITSMSVEGDPVYAWTPVAINATVKNDSTGPCNQFFWTDLYVYTDTATIEVGDQGVQWKGIGSLGANSSTALEFDHTFTVSATYYLYGQTDSFGFVSEAAPDGESNNVYGPLTVSVAYAGDTPTPTHTPEVVDPGSISGTVWAFIGGELVVPSERVNMSLSNGGYLIQSGLSESDGSYTFLNVSADTGYIVTGRVEIDGVMYQGIVVGIQVLAGEETSPVDIVLYPI